MLQVELDIFSGNPNPKWVLADREEQELIDRLTAEPEQVSPAYTVEEQFGLGYRGLIVRHIKSTNTGAWEKRSPDLVELVPSEFRVGSKRARAASAADYLLQNTARRHPVVDDEILRVASSGIQHRSSAEVIDPTGLEQPPDSESPGSTHSEPGQLTEIIRHRPPVPLHQVGWNRCGSNLFDPNARYFNQPSIMPYNNCYCFASNHVANSRGARPGRRGGKPALWMNCGSVVDGLIADGWKVGCQANTLTIALVIWYGYDYHFYRLVTGPPYWWWAHKPGSTPARYYDDCEHALCRSKEGPFGWGFGPTPETCCRGFYHHFCGYFYQDNWTAYVA